MSLETGPHPDTLPPADEDPATLGGPPAAARAGSPPGAVRRLLRRQEVWGVVAILGLLAVNLVKDPGYLSVTYSANNGALVGNLVDIVRASAPILLISLSYPDGQIAGPPFSTPLTQVTELFGATYNIGILETRDGLAQSPNLRERGVTALDEAAYVLRPKVV